MNMPEKEKANDEVIDEVIKEEQASDDDTCPVCKESFKDVKRHMKVNPKCSAELKKRKETEEKDGYKKPALVQKENVPAVTIEEEEDEIEHLGTAHSPIAPPEKMIKLIKDLPIEKIPRVGDELATKIRKSLEAKDIVSVYQLANADISQIKIKDVGPVMWNAVVSLACEAAGLFYLKPASEIKNTSMVLSTGVPAINNLLSIDEEEQGGFETGEGYLIYAKNASGKTQICVKLVVMLQLEVEKGGFHVPGKPRPDAVWIDTEEVGLGLIKPTKTGKSRLRQVARNTFLRAYPELDPSKATDEAKIREFVSEVEKHCLYCKAPNTRRQMQVVRTLLKDIASMNIKLIIVDSLIENFRVEYAGRGELAERQQTLNTHIKDLRLLKENDSILVCTDQAVDTPDAGTYGSNPEFNFKAAGGNVMMHGINIIIQLLKTGSSRVAKISDAGHLSPDQASFIINEFGIDSLGGATKKEKTEDVKKRKKEKREKAEDTAEEAEAA